MPALLQTLAVSQHLSFRHAAQALGISQSSVSARIRRLEQELGVSLFDRSTRGVRLTEAGRKFVELVNAGIDQIELAVTTAGREAAGEHGRLRIGIQHLIPGSFLDDLLVGYRDAYPGIAIELREGASHDAIADLRAGRIDVAFVGNAPELPDCHSRPVWTEAVWAALPQNHPIASRSGVTWADLAGETFLVRNSGTGPEVHDYIILRLGNRWPPPQVQWVGVERATLLSMVGRNFGITIVGAMALLLPVVGVVFLPITDEPEPAVFSAIWSPHNRGAALRNLFALADELNASSRSVGGL
jgi:DNA-binding transcriptional LysR family regulator